MLDKIQQVVSDPIFLLSEGTLLQGVAMEQICAILIFPLLTGCSRKQSSESAVTQQQSSVQQQSESSEVNNNQQNSVISDADKSEGEKPVPPT